MRDLSIAARRRALVVGAEQVRLLQRLGAAGIDVLAVKGLVLSQQLYGNLAIRHIGDIDLFIRRRDAIQADAIFQSAGLRRTRPDFALTPRQTAAFLALKPEFEYLSPPAAIRVELLWQLEGLPEALDPWANAMPAPPLGGQPLRTLPPELNAIYLFQHGARHGWFRLFWLVDIALLLRDPSINWENVIAVARQARLERPLLQGAALAVSLLSASVPRALAPRRREERVIARLVAESRRQIARAPQPNEPVGEWSRQLIYRMQLAHGSGAGLAAFKPHLFSPLNWHTCPLPDRWFFLYPLLSPFLWIYRRLRR